MGNLFEDVRPGDVITAELMNRVLREIERLDAAVVALSGTGALDPQIESLLPSEQLALGAELQIVGTGFGRPENCAVTVDGIPALPIKPTSTSTFLVVDVPAVPGVPVQGKQVTVRVSNAGGFDTAPLTVIQAQPTIPSGQLAVTLAQAPAGNLAPGNHTFVFSVKAITDMQDTYTLQATIDQPGWSAAIVDEAGNPAATQIQIPVSPSPNGTTRQVRVRLTIPGGAAAGIAGKLRLRVVSQLNPTGLTGSSGDLGVTVNAPPPPPQDKVQVTRTGLLNATVAGDDVVVATEVQARVDFVALIADPGSYTISFSLEGGTAGIAAWRPQLGTVSPFSTGAPNAPKTVMVALRPTAGAQPDTLTVRVQAASNPTVFGSFSQPIRRP